MRHVERPADDASVLVLAGRRQSVSHAHLFLPQSRGERVSCSALLDTLIYPRDEEEVAGACLDRTGAREEKVREPVPKRAEP
jgi:hypothetical protein